LPIETLTNDIRVMRLLAHDMTQANLGKRVGLTRQTIAAIEQGRYAPSLEVAFRIAYVFGKSIDEVFRWTPGDALLGSQAETPPAPDGA
jgi:putative transcriptional regulator